MADISLDGLYHLDFPDSSHLVALQSSVLPF